MRNIQLIVILIGLFQVLESQTNLLPNPSFEFTTGCPASSGDWNVCSSWNNVNMNIGAGFWGTPDFYHACGGGQTAPPNLFSGTCSPQSGLAMMSIVVYNMGYAQYREYIASPLNCSMKPGSTYTLSFWISNGTGYLSPWTIKNIGAHFSVGPLTQTSFLPINVVPQCEITTNVVSPGWTQYTFTFVATAAWDYLTLGAFRTDASNNVTLSWPNPGGPASAYANYFVDNINVLENSGGASQVSVSISPQSASICAGQSAILSVSGASSFLWSNSSTASSISVSPSVTTVFSVTGSTSGSCGVSYGNATIFVSVTPLPIVIITGGQAICAGKSATLNANGAQSYLWNNGVSSQSIVVFPSSSTNYTVTGTANGCANSNTVGVSLSPNPTITINGNTTVCAGKNSTLTATGAANYQWSNGSNNPTIVITPINTTTFSVIGTMGTFSCPGSAVVTVSVTECTGLQLNSFREETVTVSPNPFRDEISINCSFKSERPFVIRIYNALGHQVFETNGKKTPMVEGAEVSFSPGDLLPAGIYFLEFTFDGCRRSLRVIKE